MVDDGDYQNNHYHRTDGGHNNVEQHAVAAIILCVSTRTCKDTWHFRVAVLNCYVGIVKLHSLMINN